MPRGYRYIVLAALGWLSLTAANSEHYHRQQGNSQTRYKQESSAPPFVEPTASATPDHPAQKECINANYEPDDCARASAQATIDQARYAYWQSIGGWVSVFAGLGTLGAAVWAGNWAKAAAKHTEAGAIEAKRAADAAEESIVHSSRIGEAQTRAYLAIQSLKGGRDAHGISICATVINSGQSPAMVETVRIRVMFGDGKKATKRVDARHPIPAGAVQPLARCYFIEDDSNTESLIIHAEVFYKDVFKTLRFAQADFVGPAEWIDGTGDKFVPVHDVTSRLENMRERGEIEN